MTLGIFLALSVAVIGSVVGLVGTILPLLPGLPLIFVSILLYAIVTGFSSISGQTIIILGVLTVAAYFLDLIVVARGVTRAGGTSRGAIGSIVGAIVGLIVASVPGLLIGLFLGAIAGEISTGASGKQALRAGAGAFLGFLASSVFRFLLGVAMIIITLIDAFRG